MTPGAKKTVLFSFLFLYLLLWGAVARSGEMERLQKNEALAVGTAEIVGENLARAKEAAISMALKKGVENYLLRRLGPGGAADNFERLVEEIIPGSKEAVENFLILAEEQVGERWQVLVDLRINETLMDEKLREAGVVVMEGPPLRIVFLVSETAGGHTVYWWKSPEVPSSLSPVEVALYNRFQERGFSPVDRVAGLPEAQYGEALKALDLGEEAILKWGSLLSADVVVHGEMKMDAQNGLTLFLEAFDVNQGTRICGDAVSMAPPEGTAGETETGVPVVEEAVKTVVERMAPVMIRSLMAGREAVHSLAVRLEGLTCFKQFKVFRDFLREEVKGVRSVRQTRVTRAAVSFAVEFQGDRRRFIQRVLGHENLPFLLEADDSGEGEVTLRLKPEETRR